MRRPGAHLRLAGAVVVFLALVLALPAPLAAASSRASRARAVAPVSRIGVHEFARANGFQVNWIVPGRKLRVRTGATDLVFEANKREVLVNDLRVFMGEAALTAPRTLSIAVLDRDRLLLPIVAPQKSDPRRPVRTIVLDPGHGGNDTGTRNRALKLDEKNLTLDVARRLATMLEARGFRVVLTRTDNTYVGLSERAARAASARADLFVSLHFNAAPAADVRGLETYTVTPQFQRSTGSDRTDAGDLVAVAGNRFDEWNAYLGYTLHRTLRASLGLSDRGLKRARFVVLRELGVCPGVLVEGGYLSNRAEAQRLGDRAFRQRLATAIADGIVAYNDTLKRLAASRAPKAR